MSSITAQREGGGLNRKQKIVNYLLAIILIVYSGNPFFIYAEKVREAFIAITILMVGISLANARKKIFSQYLKYIGPLALILIYQLLALPTASFSSITFMLMKFFIGTAIICYIGSEFPKVYVNTIAVVAVISLVFFAYNLSGGFLPGIPIGRITISIIVYTQLLDTTRNSGMFWEPGAFQSFLNLALVMMLNMQHDRKAFYKAAIIVIAILTTQSTTGYIVLMVIGAYYLYTRKQSSKVVNAFFLVAFLAMSFYVYNSTGFLGEKVEESLYGDSMETGRIGEYTLNSKMLMENPFFGMSYNDKISSGNGFFYQLLSVGFMGTIYLFGFLYFRIKKNTSAKFSFFFLVVSILLYQGEVLGTHPLFMALPFISFMNNAGYCVSSKRLLK